MHTVTPYSIRCFNPDAKNVKQKHFALSDIKGNDLFLLLNGFFKSIAGAYHPVDDEKAVYSCRSVDSNESTREIWGYFCVGHYGVNSDIISVNNGEVVFNKGEENADVFKYYFRFSLPSGSDEGVCLFHAYRGDGFKTIFLTMFNKYFKNKTGLPVIMNTLSDENLIKKWAQGEVKELKVVRFKPAPDIVDRLKGFGHIESEYVVRPQRRKILGRFSDFTTNGSEQAKIVEFLEQDAEEVKVTVSLGGQKRTLRVGKNANNRLCQVDVDLKIVQLVGGIPSIDSMNPWASILLQDFMGKIYPGGAIS